MSKLENKEDLLLDLWLPYILPIAGAGEAWNLQGGQIFVLTGWRGAGWHMTFLEELDG
jgi:hypothetical protein